MTCRASASLVNMMTSLFDPCHCGLMQVWFQNRRSKERRMKQLSALGARRHAFFRGPRRMRPLGGRLEDPDILGPGAYGYYGGKKEWSILLHYSCSALEEGFSSSWESRSSWKFTGSSIKPAGLAHTAGCYPAWRINVRTE